jgi:hypothetical protein
VIENKKETPTEIPIGENKTPFKFDIKRNRNNYNISIEHSNFKTLASSQIDELLELESRILNPIVDSKIKREIKVHLNEKDECLTSTFDLGKHEFCFKIELRAPRLPDLCKPTLPDFIYIFVDGKEVFFQFFDFEENKDDIVKYMVECFYKLTEYVVDMDKNMWKFFDKEFESASPKLRKNYWEED